MKKQNKPKCRPLQLRDFTDAQLEKLDRMAESASLLKEQYRKLYRETLEQEGRSFWGYVKSRVLPELERPSRLIAGCSDKQIRRLVKEIRKRRETENFLWLIEWLGSGYQGRMFYIGPENKVEQIRVDKCRWEHCLGFKYKLRAPYSDEKEGEQA